VGIGGESWRGDDQRDAGRLFVVGVLAPDAMIAKVPAMVTPQDDDGVFGEPQSIQLVEHATGLRVHVARRGVIAMDQRPLQLVRQLAAGGNVLVPAKFAAGLRGVAGRSHGRGLWRSQLERGRVVQIPIFLGRDERQVWLEKSDRQEERLLVVLLCRSQTQDRFVGDHAVAVTAVRHIRALIGGTSGALLAVSRPLGALRQRVAAPLGTPGRDAPGVGVVSVPMADVINLAQPFGAIALRFEMLAQRDGVGGRVAEMGRQVVDPERLWPQTGHQRIARR